MTSLSSIVLYVDANLLKRAQAAAHANDANLSSIIRAAIRSQAERGQPPVGRSLQKGERTTKVRLYAPADLKEALARLAATDGMSRSTWTARALADVLDRAAMERAPIRLEVAANNETH